MSQPLAGVRVLDLTRLLPGETWIRFAVWLVIGLSLYAFYGHRHSRLRAPAPPTSGGA